MHTAIKEKKTELEPILTNCQSVLNSLNELLLGSRSLGSDRPRVIDRLRFGSKDIARIRGQLVLYTSTIGLFLVGLDTGSLGRIEQRLDEIIAEMRSGKQEPTATVIFGDNNEARDINWRRLASKLQRKGMSSEDIEAHKNGIHAYVQEQVEKYRLPIRDIPESSPLPSAEPTENATTTSSSEGPSKHGKNTSPSEGKSVYSPMSTNVDPRPERPLPALSRSSIPSPATGVLSDPTFRVPPPLPSPYQETYFKPHSDIFETTTDVQEFNDLGHLRNRTITRHSSNGSMRSTLPSTHTSPSSRPISVHTLDDLSAENELTDFSLGSTPKRPSSRAVSCDGSATSLGSKQRV